MGVDADGQCPASETWSSRIAEWDRGPNYADLVNSGDRTVLYTASVRLVNSNGIPNSCISTLISIPFSEEPRDEQACLVLSPNKKPRPPRERQSRLE